MTTLAKTGRKKRWTNAEKTVNYFVGSETSLKYEMSGAEYHLLWRSQGSFLCSFVTECLCYHLVTDYDDGDRNFENQNENETGVLRATMA